MENYSYAYEITTLDNLSKGAIISPNPADDLSKIVLEAASKKGILVPTFVAVYQLPLSQERIESAPAYFLTKMGRDLMETESYGRNMLREFVDIDNLNPFLIQIGYPPDLPEDVVRSFFRPEPQRIKFFPYDTQPNFGRKSPPSPDNITIITGMLLELRDKEEELASKKEELLKYFGGIKRDYGLTLQEYAFFVSVINYASKTSVSKAIISSYLSPKITEDPTLS